MNDRILTLGDVMMTLATTIVASTQIQESYAPISPKEAVRVAIFENDVYVIWWTNMTGNNEAMFRVSTDAGKTFADKINLSNTPTSDSVDVEISADEGKVAVAWWERTQTANEPVTRVSTDNGKNFGPLLKLATNGTIRG